MNDELPERELLRMIDPAPRTISDDDRMRNLRRVLQRVDLTPSRQKVPHSPRLRLLTRLVLPAGLAAVALAIAVPLTLGPPPGDSPGVTSPGAVLVGSTTQAGVRILAMVTAGDARFLLGERGGDVRFGASFDGSDPDDSWETFGTPEVVAEDGFTLVNPGNFPDAAPNGIATVTGQVGDSVMGVDIRTHAGALVTATLADGFYIAAWEGRDFDGPDTLDAEFILHLADGSTRTIPYADAIP